MKTREQLDAEARGLLDALRAKGALAAKDRTAIPQQDMPSQTPEARVRNTREVDVIDTLRAQGLAVDVYDPCVDAREAEREYGLSLLDAPAAGSYDAIVLAVAHREFLQLDAASLRGWGKPACVVYDVKSVLPRDWVDGRL